MIKYGSSALLQFHCHNCRCFRYRGDASRSAAEGRWIEFTRYPGRVLPTTMGSGKVECRPKGGAPRLNASTISESLRRNNVVSALLCFTCGACFVLSLICTCLATLIVLLDHTVEAASYGRHGEKDPPKVYPGGEVASDSAAYAYRC